MIISQSQQDQSQSQQQEQQQQQDQTKSNQEKRRRQRQSVKSTSQPQPQQQQTTQTKSRSVQSQPQPEPETESEDEQPKTQTRLRQSQPQHRSNIKAICTLMTSQLPKTTERHWQAVELTPFSNFYRAFRQNKVQESKLTKKENDVREIIRTYEPKDKKFKFGKLSKEFTENDVKLIFGICCGKEEMDLKPMRKEHSSFAMRRFATVERLTTKIIRDELIKSANGRTKQDEEDFARLLVLFTCSALLFSNTGSKLGWATVHYVDDMKNMRKYNWAQAVKKHLMDDIHHNYKEPEKVKGCVMALLVSINFYFPLFSLTFSSSYVFTLTFFFFICIFFASVLVL